MTISVVGSTGIGNTLLSSFDNALKNAGVYNYNLISLSSIIPTGFDVVKVKKIKSPVNEIGWRLYVVMADIRTDDPDKYIAAGIGWYKTKNGAGVFVEHKSEGNDEKKVTKELENKIATSIEDLCKFRKEVYNKKNLNMEISVAKPSKKPHCALSIAVYKAEPW